ncbi:MAG: HAD-IIB family hydrolase [Verrucomicrobiota bacterium]|nr:HAD family phosphatase [Chthoniobacterales bacterium]MDQ3414395.1 HAD-IIB family hydrolase [Verrucomicrobiota bacterium]
MPAKIQLLSTDFDGTLVSHANDPVFDRECMELIRELQTGGAIWAINTGRSVGLLEEGLEDFAFPMLPDFILTSERDVFRPTQHGWEPYGDWNARCAQAHAELYDSASSVFAEVVDFVSRRTKARVVYEADAVAGLIATNEEEMDRLAKFIDRAKAGEPKFHYQRNTVYLRFCHADYHKGAALEELSRLTEIPREATFAAGDHHNDISMLDGRYAAFPSCPANAIAEVKEAVRRADGRVAEKEFGAGVHEALQHFLCKRDR